MTADQDVQVREMLRARASSITPSVDGLERIEAKLAGESPVVATPARRRPPMPMLAAAAVLVVVAAIGVLLATRQDDEQPILTTPGPSAAKELGAVWPTNDPEVLRGITEPWAMDDSPREAARRYVQSRIPGMSIADADLGEPVEGELGVSVSTPASIVTLQRLDGDGPWYVTMSSSPNVAGLDLQRVGEDVGFNALAGADGELTITVRDPGGEDEATAVVDAVEGETASVAVHITSAPLATGTVAVAAVLRTVEGDAFLSELPLPAQAPAPATDGVPLGVWPWPNDSVDESVFTDAGDTARAYVASRITDVGATTELGRTESDGVVAITFSGDVATTVHLRQDGARWYVESSASDLVTLHDAGDGTVTARVETGGVLLRETAYSGAPDAGSETSTVQGGEEYLGLGYTLGRDDVAIRELFVLDTGDGTIGITETSFRAGEAPTEPDSPTTPTGEEQLGVWPMLGFDIDAETRSDPVAMAARYLAETVGTTASTVVSEFRQQDTTSGEVEVTGDITATIVLRSIDGQWHVETVWSPLVEARELAPGQVSLRAAVDGVLTVTVFDSTGVEVQSMPASGVTAGEERLVVPDAPDGTPLTVRWMLQTPMDAETDAYANTALGDVRLYGGACCSSEPAVETPVPDDAIWDVAALDARELASQYLGDRLGDGRTVTTDDAAIEGDRAEVTWEAGVVLLRKVDDLWFVTEAIGDSIQIESPTTLRLAQAGTVHVTRGTQTLDVRNDVDQEDTIVEFDLPGESDILRAVFETDSGFVSLAERKMS